MPLATLLSLSIVVILIVGLISPRFLLYVGLFFLLVDSLQLTFNYSIGSPIPQYRLIIFPWAWFFVLALISRVSGRLTGLYTPSGYSNTVDLPILVLGLSGWITLLWNPYLHDGITQQMNCFQGLLCYFAVTRLVQTTEQFESFCKFWLFAGLFLVGVFVLSIFVGQTEEQPISYLMLAQERVFLRLLQLTKYQGLNTTISGLTVASKHLSSLLTIAVPLVVALMLANAKTVMRSFYNLAILLMLVLLILSFSRVDLLGLIGGWFAFAFLNPLWRSKLLRIQLYAASYLVVAFFIVVVLLYSFYEAGFNDFKARYLFGPSYNPKLASSSDLLGAGSADVRYHRFRMAMEKIWETGGLGAGSGGIGLEPGHNIEIGTLLLGIFFVHGFGLFSYLLFAWLAVNLFMEMRKALRHCHDERYMIFLHAVCWIFVSYLLVAFLDYNLLYWLAVGLGIAAIQAIYPNDRGRSTDAYQFI